MESTIHVGIRECHHVFILMTVEEKSKKYHWSLLKCSIIDY